MCEAGEIEAGVGVEGEVQEGWAVYRSKLGPPRVVCCGPRLTCSIGTRLLGSSSPGNSLFSVVVWDTLGEDRNLMIASFYRDS